MRNGLALLVSARRPVDLRRMVVDQDMSLRAIESHPSCFACTETDVDL